jgi:hypothetical protein
MINDKDAIANMHGAVADAPSRIIESISEASLRLGEPNCAGCAHGRFRNRK